MLNPLLTNELQVSRTIYWEMPMVGYRIGGAEVLDNVPPPMLNFG